MKTGTRNLILLSALIAGIGLIPAGRVTAQTFTTLHSFTGASGPPLYTNSDGTGPYAGLLLSSNTLYGAAADGGSLGAGTVFAVNTDGTGFTILHSFTAISVPERANSDGARPFGGLILSGNTLYGTTERGGSSGVGTVFAVNTDGTGFLTLHNFSAVPPFPGPFINSDGARPYAGLILSGTTLYGTAASGGSGGNGTVFAIDTYGTGFTTLYSFTGAPDPLYTNSDGVSPASVLILSGTTLYGTTTGGGSSGNGTVFRVNTDGTGFTNLHSFASATSFGNNSEGANPSAGLILSGNTLYGTAVGGGSGGNGTVFAVNTDGTGFTTLHRFTCTITNPGQYPPHADCDGARPEAELILSGKTLYGTTLGGGSGGNGTVFSLSFAPRLTISPSGADVILTWPTNVAGFDYTGFTLQSTTNLISPAVWSPVSPTPVVVNGQNAVTNRISGTQRFYRLSQ